MSIIKISLISLGAIALIIIAYFIYKKRTEKQEDTEPKPIDKEKKEAEIPTEEKKVGEFSQNLTLTGYIRKGDTGKQVEQLQYWIEKKYKEDAGQTLKFKNVGVFDDATEQYLYLLTGQNIISLDDFKKKRIDSYKTYKIK